MNTEDQLIELDSTIRCKLGPSPIHGIGVFAIRDILKGQKCGCRPCFLEKPPKEMKWYTVTFKSLDRLFPEVKELILQRWPAIALGSGFISPNDMNWTLTYINHSEKPNYDVDTDTATEDIAKGEEIVQDYRRMTNYEKVYPWLSTP